MTEKQLREGLQDYLASAGLPDKRREALLAAVRAEAPPPPMKGEPNMFRPNKFRTALIAAAIVTLLTFTVALAAGFSGFVNIKGEKMDMSGMLMARPTPEPSPLTATDEPETDYFALVNDILLNAPTEYLVTASYQEDGIHHSNGHPIQLQVDTWEQLAAMVGDDSLMLPIPDGWKFCPGYARLSCAADSAYELVSEETTPEGITVSMYRIPEGKALVRGYVYSIQGADGTLIGVQMELSRDAWYRVNETDTVEPLDLPGMADALLITRPDTMSLAARRPLSSPVEMWSTHPDGWERGYTTDIHDTVTYEVYSWGDLIPTEMEAHEIRQVMLSMFDK